MEQSIIIKTHKISLVVAVLIAFFGIALGTWMLYCDLNRIPFSKDGSHRILYAFTLLSVFACICEMLSYLYKRWVIEGDALSIYRFKKPVCILSLAKDVGKVEIYRRKIGRKSNRVHIRDKANRDIFSTTVSDKECAWLEEYFKPRVRLYVSPGFEK